ncbi:RWD domain protein [Teladorsagia circumcincta]|uniref:RWD domain protein n=1 Tax=Teladorsagia circumcincta TaxID=45464 RepID=A0A2G9TSH4_TELCI|nr:RWD domain protein [Teladorsagia circumcincta]
MEKSILKLNEVDFASRFVDDHPEFDASIQKAIKILITMDYKEQQTQEIEALQAIYQEEELEVTCDQYPNISLRVNLKSNQENECACDFDVALVLQLPETYPDVIPRISLEGLEDIFTDDRVQQAVQVTGAFCSRASVVK